MGKVRTNKRRINLTGNGAKIWGGRFHIDICITRYPVNLNDIVDVLEEGIDLLLSAGEDTGGFVETNKTNDEEGQEAFRL